MKISNQLQEKIITLLTSLPNIDDNNSQRAFMCHAGLDAQLQDLITTGLSPIQFIPLLVSTSIKYGTLENGKYAIEAILEAVPQYVGQEKKAESVRLLQELHAQQSSNPNDCKTEMLSQIQRDLLLANPIPELTKCLFKIEEFLSIYPRDVEGKTLQTTIIRAIKNEQERLLPPTQRFPEPPNRVRYNNNFSKITKPISNRRLFAWFTIIIIFFILSSIIFLRYYHDRSKAILSCDKFGIHMITPKSNQVLKQPVETVEGIYQYIPDGWELWLFSITRGDGYTEYRPKVPITVKTSPKTWENKGGVYFGDKDSEAELGVFLVGKN